MTVDGGNRAPLSRPTRAAGRVRASTSACVLKPWVRVETGHLAPLMCTAKRCPRPPTLTAQRRWLLDSHGRVWSNDCFHFADRIRDDCSKLCRGFD